MNDLFPDLQQQLDKLTVIRYDHIQETNAQRDEKLRGSRHTNKGRKVSSICLSLRQYVKHVVAEMGLGIMIILTSDKQLIETAHYSHRWRY